MQYPFSLTINRAFSPDPAGRLLSPRPSVSNQPPNTALSEVYNARIKIMRFRDCHFNILTNRLMSYSINQSKCLTIVELLQGQTVNRWLPK